MNVEANVKTVCEVLKYIPISLGDPNPNWHTGMKYIHNLWIENN